MRRYADWSRSHQVPHWVSEVNQDAQHWRPRSTCGTNVAAGSTCQLGVTFTPKVHGNARGAVSLIDSASSKPQVILLEGIGQ